MNARLTKQHVKASLIWSVDEAARVGLLDVLPASATKLHAVQFLRERKGFGPENTVFAGDSGNDLPVVTSGELQCVLVKNAHPDVIDDAKKALQEKGASEQLYVAQGGFLQMNGNYSAGVLEGVAHFLPQVKAWLE
jgi:hydroxymethylpyrimidine pyrophosphatase-like HAD family hydrolase